MKIFVLTIATGIAYAISVWLAIPFALALGFCVLKHCDSHCALK